MTDTMYQPPTPDRLVADHLSTMVTAPAEAGVALSPEWKIGHAPALVVFDDGGEFNWPIMVTTRLRITVWASDRTSARGMASWAMGYLLSQRIDGIADISDPTPIINSLDKSNNGNTASFTVRARARTTSVAYGPYVP